MKHPNGKCQPWTGGVRIRTGYPHVYNVGNDACWEPSLFGAYYEINKVLRWDVRTEKWVDFALPPDGIVVGGIGYGSSLAFYDDGLGDGSKLYIGGVSPRNTPGCVGLLSEDGDSSILGPGLMKYNYDQWNSGNCRVLFVWDGKLICGGDFTRIGSDTPASCVVAWDGEEFSSLGMLSGACYSLAAYGGGLVASGMFGQSVLLWDGSTWTDLEFPFESSLFYGVSVPQVLTHDGTLFASAFRVIPDVTTNGIWMYNGAGWTQILSNLGTAARMIVHEDTLLYSASGPLWAWSGTIWNQVSPAGIAGQRLVVADGAVVSSGLAAWGHVEWRRDVVRPMPFSDIALGTPTALAVGNEDNWIWKDGL